MRYSTRKEFLQTTAGLLAAAIAGTSFDVKKNKPLLSFSTLGCPDWSFQQIINFAVQHKYKGIEVRGLQREMNITQCQIFNSQQIAATLQMMKDRELSFVNLGSSATLHFAEGAEREKNLDEAKRFIDLAQKINCPYIRVFPNLLPKSQEKNITIDLISKGLIALGDYAKGSTVSVLMETHGDLVQTEDLEKIMLLSSHPNVGLVWDISNMWTVTKESPAAMYKKLKKYIRHTHIKDAMLVNKNPQYTLLGKGDVPIFEAISILQKDGYQGYYSFEWEKLWHPELDEPEIALAHYSNTMQKRFSK